jgi:zona occludens toxin (predicted ATPase)
MKFLFLLMIFFAGFATAIYVVVPAPAQAGDQAQVSSDTQVDSQDSSAVVINHSKFTRIMSISVHKFVDIAKEGANKAVEYIKERQSDEK